MLWMWLQLNNDYFLTKLVISKDKNSDQQNLNMFVFFFSSILFIDFCEDGQGCVFSFIYSGSNKVQCKERVQNLKKIVWLKATLNERLIFAGIIRKA